MSVQEELLKRLEKKEDRIIDIRRYLHEHPELSFHEKETHAYIKKFYEGKDCVVKDCGDGYGITVDIDSGKPGKHLAIRADFDALPIQEDSGVPFASKNPGVMHACGHDGHTAYMLVLAETLIEMKDQLQGKIRILHQPAEEVPPGGAIGMIKAGCLDGIDHVIGIHVMSTMPTGIIAYREGAVQTGRASFSLTFHGKGGHGSSPHLANDAIVAASQFVVAVQTIVSRRVNPFDTASVTIGSFDAKGAFNVIQGDVTLMGDVRIMNEQTRQLVEKNFHQIAEGIAATFGMTVDIDYKNDYPVLVNDPKLTTFVANSLEDAHLPRVTSVERCDPQPPSEDFAYYALERPSCFFYVGCAPDEGPAYPHHNPKFIINEKSLLTCAQAMGTVVVDYLEGNFD